MSEDVDPIQVARILKSNGTDGELLISFRDIAPEDIDTQEPVFIYCDGLPVPFFITAFAQRGRNRALVKFADVNSFDDAEEICGQAVYVNAEDYSDLDTSEEGDFSMLAGWTLEDAEGVKIGTITDYENIPGNPCLYVETKNGQVMIPLHEELILSIDEKNQTLTMEIPEGLI